MAEARDLKSLKCGFESHKGYMLAEIPVEWKVVVCQCSKSMTLRDDGLFAIGYPKRAFRTDGTRLFICKSCEKPDGFALKRCLGCSTVFLKDFSHPRWVLDSPHCWTCINSLDEATKGRAADIQVGYQRQPMVRPTLRRLYLHITEPDRPRTNKRGSFTLQK